MDKVCDAFRRNRDDRDTEYVVFYCKDCGRLTTTEFALGDIWELALGDIWEHKLLPTPKIVPTPVHNWCKCKEWKNKKWQINMADANKIDPTFCPFCGEELVKTKTED